MNNSISDPKTLFINNCTFNTCQAQRYGGIVYLENTDVQITNSTFVSNSVADLNSGKGGVIFTYCSVQSQYKCATNLTDSVFISNSAPLEGGVVKYNLYEPTLSNVSFVNNSAGYGNDIASFPLRLKLLDEKNQEITQNDTSQIFASESGSTFVPAIRAGIYDMNGIIDVQDVSYGYINITANNQALTSISKNTVAQPTNGILIFDDFIVSAEPGDIAEMRITFEDIDVNKLSILGLDPSLAEIIFNVSLNP